MNTHTQFILFFCLAIIFNIFEWMQLAVVFLAILPWLLLSRNLHFYRLIRRLKWFFVVLLLIYMFSTPGQYMLSWPFAYQPTYEGVSAGVSQLLRIVLIVAMLSIIYQQNNKQMLISGIYALIKPLQSIGVDIDRFAVRLWLTLYYVDSPTFSINTRSIPSLFDSVQRVLTDESDSGATVVISRQVYDSVDYLMVLVVAVMLVYTLFVV